ncbi:MAG TPA: helicase-related protein [Candidatus Lokiarchaeia archaeon]|nr:helicase-related protein [Candidatus Lokiarchaeia archaeon]
MTSESPGVIALQPGMKVIARNNSKLGVGEIFSVESEEILHYKVIFPSPPVKTLYPHEVTHFSIPANALVQTKYGAGKIIRKMDDEEEFYKYEIEFFKDKVKKILKETVITRVSRGIPVDQDPTRLITVDAMVLGWFLNAYYFRYCLPSDPRFQAVCHGRIEAFPHQIKVINQVLGTYPSRFLLCDEVGLGKTIEALAIVKELILQNVVNRVIVIVPANLVKQWQFEMTNKFNLDFTIYDGAYVKELKAGYPGINPWTLHQRILTSLHFVRRDETRAALKEVFFDMAIFDEAHHLRRYSGSKETYRKTKNYDLGEIVCNQSRVVLLLTATPMQLNPFELFSLIQLLDPSLFPKYSSFLEFKEKISHYNLVIRNLDRFGRLNVFEKKYMLEMVEDLLEGNEIFSNQAAIQEALTRRLPGIKDAIVQSIRNKHLLSKILIRNKKRLVFQGFMPKRNTKILLVEPTKEELDIYKAIRLYITTVYQRSIEEKNNATGFVMVVFQRLLASSHVALRKTIQLRVATLRELEVKLLKLRAQIAAEAATMTEEECEKKLADVERRIANIDEDVPLLNDYYAKLVALKYDSKASALVNLTRSMVQGETDTKIIVFTQFIRTLYYLKKVLETNVTDVDVSVFHGKLSKEEKDTQIERFKSSDGKPHVLVSTEAGGEGRNFQFCHNMINYDLPWNPMKLEQRIGRIDRIGQNHDVNIYNFALKDTVEENIVAILSERIYSFQEIVGELEPILVNFEDDIGKAILTSRSDDDLDLKFQLLGSKITEKLNHLKEHRSSMQDVIMDLESKDLFTDISASCNIELNYYTALKSFVFRVLDLFNGENHPIPEDVDAAIKSTLASKGVVNPVAREIKEKVYLINEGMAGEHVGTFDRGTALTSEQLEFFNLGHPFIEKLIDASITIDITKFMGYLVDTPDHLTPLLAETTLKEVRNDATIVITCNGVDMTGVKNRRQLAFEAFLITRESGKATARDIGTIPGEVFIEFLLDQVDGRDIELPENPLLSKSLFPGILALNARSLNALADSLHDDWKADNEKLYERMKEREEHYHMFRVKKHEDEILQYKFMIGEKIAPESQENEDKSDRKAIKTLESKVAKAEEKIKEEREKHAKIMQEITESYRRLDISVNLIGIVVILVRS